MTFAEAFLADLPLPQHRRKPRYRVLHGTTPPEKSARALFCVLQPGDWDGIMSRRIRNADWMGLSNHRNEEAGLHT